LEYPFNVAYQPVFNHSICPCHDLVGSKISDSGLIPYNKSNKSPDYFWDFCFLWHSKGNNKFQVLYIINIIYTFVENIQHLIMTLKRQVVFPKQQKILEQVGENIKLARKRRKLTTIQVAERAGIDRTTLYHIEKGRGSVSMAAYLNTLRVLGLQDDFLKLAADDIFGRKLQDLKLIGGK